MNSECCNNHLIINSFYEKLYGFVYKKTGNREIAKDITQDAIVKLIDAYNKNLKIEYPKAWLFKVTNNLIVDYYRKSLFLIFQKMNLKKVYSMKIPTNWA